MGYQRRVHGEHKTQDMSEEECKALFKRIDTDGDGSLSEAELKVVFGDDAAKTLKEFDKNEDGGVDEAGWLKALTNPAMTKCLDDDGTTWGGKYVSTMNKCLDDGTIWSGDLLD